MVQGGREAISHMVSNDGVVSPSCALCGHSFSYLCHIFFPRFVRVSWCVWRQDKRLLIQFILDWNK